MVRLEYSYFWAGVFCLYKMMAFMTYHLEEFLSCLMIFAKSWNPG